MTHSQFLSLLSEIAAKHSVPAEHIQLTRDRSDRLVAARSELATRLREAGLSRQEISRKTGLSVRMLVLREKQAEHASEDSE